MHRDGCDPHNIIYESDFLNKYQVMTQLTFNLPIFKCVMTLQSNIIVAKEWIANTVSSTKIRRAVRRGDSIKYLVPDRAVKMIQQIYSSNNK
jgi:nicotinic acid mononucleotide adenylyltransferase